MRLKRAKKTTVLTHFLAKNCSKTHCGENENQLWELRVKNEFRSPCLSFVSQLGPWRWILCCRPPVRDWRRETVRGFLWLSLSWQDNSRRHMWMMVGCSCHHYCLLLVTYCLRENLFHIWRMCVFSFNIIPKINDWHQMYFNFVSQSFYRWVVNCLDRSWLIISYASFDIDKHQRELYT